MNFEQIFSSWLGTFFYSVCVFSLGAWVGRPMFSWVYNKLPWVKS